MKNYLLAQMNQTQIPLYVLRPAILQTWLARCSGIMRQSISANRFTAKAGQSLVVMGAKDQPVLLAGIGDTGGAEQISFLPQKLGAGEYVLAFAPGDLDRTQMAQSWLTGCYAFDQHQNKKTKCAAICIAGADHGAAVSMASATRFARDLINSPANALGTKELDEAICKMGKSFGAKVSSIVGEDLVKQNYPLIHAVGRAAEGAPRLVHLVWGNDEHPAISLVGKGVIFDTGGLNIKTGNYMRLMKKDMGGAANALALAHLIMDHNLPVFLNVFIPIVDNAISGNAYRPSDVLPSRQGLSVEIDNTDAEGRLILADALTRAVEDQPELLIDFATLTGAARVALGPEMAPFYTDEETWAKRLEAAAIQVNDPVWRMPLWDGYDALLDSDIADICHTSSSPMGGSVTAALFLRRFVADTPWIHFDIFAWSLKNRPGHPQGGDVHGALASFSMLQQAYQK